GQTRVESLLRVVLRDLAGMEMEFEISSMQFEIGPRRLTAGDGGDDADFVPVLHGRVEVLQEADVLLVDVHVDEAADRAGIVEQPFLDAGEATLQVGERVTDGSGFDGDELLVVGELKQRRGDADGSRHGEKGVGVMEYWSVGETK